MNNPNAGLLLVDKAAGSTSFRLVAILRKKTAIQKIGHAGTLDPFATGVMVMLIGKEFTKQSDQFLSSQKEYEAELHLGAATDTYDCEGKITETSPYIPSLQDIERALSSFQGEIWQTPPMFSAKKIGGKKLYQLARQGISIARPPSLVTVSVTLLSYLYPKLSLQISCSKGTYIRSLAHDLGEALSCKAHLTALRRTRSGPFCLSECIRQTDLEEPTFNPFAHFRGAP